MVSEPSDSSMSAGAKILAVIGNPTVGDFLGRLLALAEHRVSVAQCDQSALEHLRTESCDLMLTELVLTDKDPLWLIQKARELKPKLRVVIISQRSTDTTSVDGATYL